ncbi:hypothetical protein O1C26_003422 [Vibrio cholerae]|nr:hypothetical protein [Vibrio cholerae]EKF9692959.1 hypothetical protein [Vibrio cholerae]
MFTITDVFNRMHAMASVQATYWEVYAVVTLAIVTYTGSIWGRKRPVQLYIFLASSYLIFALSNAVEIYHLQLAIENAARAIESYTASNVDKVDPHFLPVTNNIFVPSTGVVVGMHVILDVIVLFVILSAFRAAYPNWNLLANKRFKRDS